MTTLYCGSGTAALVQRYTEIFNAGFKNGRAKPAPFQFTLPIMAQMYLDFQPDWLESNGVMFGGIKDKAMSVGQWEEQLRDASYNERITVTNPINDEMRLPLRAPVRAIAYFSWEEATRVFLVRRVYPSYFDFMSYSHCAERWGVLGEMMEKLSENVGEDYFNKMRLGIVELPGFSQRSLPFMEETRRLDVRSAFAIPIVKEAGQFFCTEDLLGAFVVFLQDAKSLPSTVYRTRKTVATFKNWVRTFVRLFPAAIKAQDEIFERRPGQLRELWRELADKPQKGIRIYRLKVGGDLIEDEMPEIVSAVVSALSAGYFHTVVEDICETKDDKHEARILVAPSVEARREILSELLLTAVGQACKSRCGITVTIENLCEG